MKVRMMACRLGLAAATTWFASCESLHPCMAHCADPLFRPDPASPPRVITLAPTAEWRDTKITVHKGERLFFTTTGEVQWVARDRTTTADGENGVPGWTVGPGGVRGRIGADGPLYLGFKNFTAGANTGLFEVTVRPAIAVTPP